jgi:hypothetical protein
VVLRHETNTALESYAQALALFGELKEPAEEAYVRRAIEEMQRSHSEQVVRSENYELGISTIIASPSGTPTLPSNTSRQTTVLSPVQQPLQQSRVLSRGLIIFIIVLALLIIGSSGFTYYAAIYQPNQLHAQATATSVAQVTGTAHAFATTAAQAFATDQAQTNATATTVTQATEEAQATQTALQTVYTQATSGTPAINDPLSAQSNLNWDVFTGSVGGGCYFSGGAYHVATPKGYYTLCDANKTNFSNFVYQIRVNIISGYSVGLAFRVNSTNYSGYIFRISTAGLYTLEKITTDIKANNTQHTTIISGTSPAIATGNNQSNQLAVVVQGNTFALYVNQQFVDSASDSTFQSGQIGTYSDSDSISGSEAAFTNAQVWLL